MRRKGEYSTQGVCMKQKDKMKKLNTSLFNFM